MFCKHCGVQLDRDSQFCPNCGAPVQPSSGFRQQGWQQPPQQPVRGYRQSVGRDPTYGRRSRRKSPVSAGFQGRIFGIPISGKAAIIILIILVIVCIILNKTGALN